jgi:hypothetical protein
MGFQIFMVYWKPRQFRIKKCIIQRSLDIQNNKIENEEVLDEILVKMPNLAVLYL